jgi:hypothetical protein
VGEDLSHGNIAATGHEVPASSGWVSTQQAARALGISPRTVRWHIEQGNLEANLEGGGAKRTWLVSIDSLQAFREARQAAGELPETLRTPADDVDIALSIPVGGLMPTRRCRTPAGLEAGERISGSFLLALY